MLTASAMLVIASHVLVCVSSDAGATCSIDAMFQCWASFIALAAGPHLFAAPTECYEQRWVRLTRAMVVVCTSVVVNAALAALASNAIAYCYLLHSTCLLALQLAADDMLTHHGRAIMVVAAAALLAGVHVFPLALPVSLAHGAAPGTSFECAHLWALVCVTASQASARAACFVAERW